MLENNKGTVIIMRGAPGSGKSTYVKNNLTNGFTCSADSYFYEDGRYKFDMFKLKEAHKNCFYIFISAIQDKRPVIVVDNTNIRVWEFERYYSFAKEHGYNVKIVRMQPTIENIVGKTIHGVPVDKVQKMYKSMEKVPKNWGLEETVVVTQY